MSKSKFPNQIDTSVEIPTVRDNITEIGSDALNAYKSAILAIERTLGVNPHGATGNTVASRLSRTLDSEGNLLPEALTQIGVITGPISDNEVSERAAIKESKLDLNFPTKLLQNEISQLQNDLDSFTDSLNELIAQFSTHIHPAALNRHKATSISVEEADVLASDEATLSIESDSLQNTIETLYNSHINYTGLNISLTNNSHTASQIYFDNSDVDEVTDANSVQGAIEDLSNVTISGIISNNINLSSNGLIRKGKVADDFESTVRFTKLIDASKITYTLSAGASKTTIIFSDEPVPADSISKFDILSITGSASDTDNRDYQIASINMSGDGKLQSVEIFGSPTLDASGSLIADIFKNPYRNYNSCGLIGTVRPRNDKSNTPDVQLANPNSAVIISNDIIPEAITSSSHTFNLSIDNNDSITIDTYDSNLSTQTLDSIINKINEQAVDQRLNFLAYKYKSNNCFELALCHNIPNYSEDVKERTLKITTGSNNDGTETLGFSSVLGTEYKGSTKNSINLNGNIKYLFGNIIKLTSSDVGFSSGTSTITLTSQTFSELGVRVGDLIVITNADNANDDGSYRIDSISTSSAVLDTSYSFAGTLGENGIIFILRVSAPIEEMTFEEINSSNGAILFDIFIDDSLDVFYQKRLEISGNSSSGSFISAIVDVSKDFILTNETASVTINTDGTAYLTDIDGNDGDSVYVAKPGDYKLYSYDKFSFITLRVSSSSLPNSAINLSIFGFDEVSKNNYIVTRGLFSTLLGRVLGYSTAYGIPTLVDKRKTGTVDETIVSDTFIEKYIEGPRNELMASGIIRGLQVSNTRLYSGYQLFDVSAGVAVINGIRREFLGKTNNRINTSNNFYVAMDEFGCIVAQQAITNPDGYTADGDETISPFYDRVVAHLAYVDSQEEIDLRLFVDHVNYKLTKDIIVSNDQNFGHFTSIKSAVAYAKRFSELFPNTGTPAIYIREGLYEVSEAIIIDFDLNIVGSGRSTIITKSGSLAIGSNPVSREPGPLETVFYIGNTTDNVSEEMYYGVVIKDLTYNTSDSLTNVGSFINLAESYQNSAGDPRLFRFENLIMSGPSIMAYSDGTDANLVGEYLLVVGFANTTTYVPTSGTYGHIIISNCFYQYAGVEYGPCRLRDIAGNTFVNISAINNIGRKLSPTAAISNFEVFEVTSSATLTEVNETSNITVIT